MTKQEQIEEIAKIVDEMYNVYTTTAEDIAEGIYNAGYRKAEEVQKETAKEILQEWADDNSSMGLDNTFVKNIAKKYSVEVQE